MLLPDGGWWCRRIKRECALFSLTASTFIPHHHKGGGGRRGGEKMINLFLLLLPQDDDDDDTIKKPKMGKGGALIRASERASERVSQV